MGNLITAYQIRLYELNVKESFKDFIKGHFFMMFKNILQNRVCLNEIFY